MCVQPRWSRSSDENRHHLSVSVASTGGGDTFSSECAFGRQHESGSDDDSDTDDDEELIFMAVLYDRKRLGVAIYDAVTTGLKTLEIDVADKEELEQVSRTLRSLTVCLLIDTHTHNNSMPTKDYRAPPHSVPGA